MASMKQGSFQGEGWRASERLSVIAEEGKTKVFFEGKPYMSWPIEDRASQRIAIAQMCELELETEEELARVFQLHVNSVRNYIRLFRSGGAQALLSQKSGPKKRWKITRSLKSKILWIALKYDILAYEAMQQKFQQIWKKHVSIWSIRQVLIENGIVEEKVSEIKEKIQQGLLFKETDEGQLDLDLDMAERIGVNAQQNEKAEEREGDEREKRELVVGAPEKRVRRIYSHSQRTYLDRLECGEYNAYAGGLLFVPLLEQYSFLPTLKRVMNTGSYEGYSFEELCLTLMYMDVFGFKSLEDFKRAYREEFGILIGRTYSPSHFTLRRFLHRILQLKKSEDLIEEFAYEYLKEEIARWGVMYIDGHFFPYYGMYPVKKGFHGVRKIPMKGSYHFLAVDENFTPWIFLVRSSSEDLLEKIPEIIEKAKKIAKDVGLEDKWLENMIVVFDREGYSAALYRHLDGRDRDDGRRRAFFITWAKYSKWAYEIPEREFAKSIVVTYKIQKAKEFKYYETERNMKKYGKIRTIVVQRESDKKRAVIYTNATKGELGTEKVVRIICRRWGEENLIKSLMEKHRIDYTPGYVMEEMPEQPMVDNPKVVELKKKKAGLAINLHKLKTRFADKILKEANDDAKLKEIKKDQLQLLEDMIKIENEILMIDLEVSKFPAELPFDQAHNGKRLLKMNYEKKRFLDCIKVLTYNMQMKMCELLLNYYEIKKEIFPALSMIVNRGGYIRLRGGELRVRLKRFKNRAIDYAARRLCEDLNNMEPVTLDKFQLPIRYEIT